MSVTAGLGTNSIHEGTNLNYGYALTGKNYTAGLAFGLGFSAILSRALGVDGAFFVYHYSQ